MLDFDQRGELVWSYDGLREWAVGRVVPPAPPAVLTQPVEQAAMPVAPPVIPATGAVPTIPLTAPATKAAGTHTRRNVIIGAAAVLLVLVVAVAALASGGTHKSSSGQGSSQTGIVAPSATGSPSGVDTTVTTSPTPAAPMSRAAYMQKLRANRAKVLSALAWVARTGAAGKISDSAFSSLTSHAGDTLSAWWTVTPPTNLKSLDHRWLVALRTASGLDSPYTSDLRGTHKKVARCLAEFENLGVSGDAGTCAHIAADLQRGLWVMSAGDAFRSSCHSITFKVLDKDAGSLKGRRYKISGQVFQIQDAGAGKYWQGYPDGITPRTSMLVAVTSEGYGMWTDNVAVAFDGRIRSVYENDLVTVWGTCVGQYSYTSVAGYDETVPLVHAKFVSKK